MFNKIVSITLFLLFIIPSFAFADVIQLPRTGQTVCYDTAGGVIDCSTVSGKGQDGDLRAGTPWPDPRFTDNADGTVTDNLTGLIWLKNARCNDTVGGIAGGTMPWANAITWSNNLADGKCGLSDWSSAGQWRLPNVNELESLVNAEQSDISAWLIGQGFTNVQGWTWSYWSSSTYAYNTPQSAWVVELWGGSVNPGVKSSLCFVWPVRAGQ